MSTPETPYTRGEMYLSAIADGDSSGIPDRPYTRKEKYLDAIATGDSSGIPETPYTREEMYLDEIARNGGGGGGGGSTLINKSVDTNGTYNASDDNADGYKKVTVNVPNSYTAGDEGKVVSNGQLVAQTAHAEVTQNGTIDTTLNNSVTVNVAEKWNYVWEASIEALPSGMLAYSYNFTAESGALYVERARLDFNHIGDCEIEIECKWVGNNTLTGPQIIVKYGERDGFKVYPASGTNKLNSNVSGSGVAYVDDITQYHVYNLKISGNNCTLTIDGTPYTGHGVTDNDYLEWTGIVATSGPNSSRNMYIKSIKYSGGSYAELLAQLTNTRMITETLVGGAE